MMNDNVARMLPFLERAAAPDQPTTLTVGTVVAECGSTWSVCAGGVNLRCCRAKSCLVTPDLGDEVLLAIHGDQAVMIAVLTGASADTRVAATGDLEICAALGALTVNAAEGVTMTTPKDAALIAGSARVTAAESIVCSRVIAVAGEQLTAQLDRVRTVADSVESVATRWIQRVERAYRFVRSEQLRADYVELSAEAAVNIRSRNTMIRSRELTKLDGDQIHIG